MCKDNKDNNHGLIFFILSASIFRDTFVFPMFSSLISKHYVCSLNGRQLTRVIELNRERLIISRIFDSLNIP